jgi:HK97 family phage portal protein
MNIIRRAYDWIGDQFGFANGQFVRIGGNFHGYSGRAVSPKSSLQTIAVLRCVTLISGAAASLPIDVYVKRGGARRPSENHPAELLLDSTPNPEMSSMDFRAAMWASFLLWGNAYARIVRDGGRIVSLWPLPPDCIEIKRKENATRDLLYLYTPPGADRPVPYEEQDILHVRWFSLDGITGLSAIGQARQAIARAQDAEEYGARFFSNGAKLSLAVQYPQKLSDKAVANIREAFESQYGGVENAHRIAILEQGATVQTMSINPKDAQFLEQEQYSDERIAMLFGVPPHMIGLVSKSTSWGSGIAEQKLGFMTFTLAPLLTFHEKAYERALLADTRESRFYIKHNLNAFLRADIKTRFESYAVGIQNGILTPNVALALEDMDPYDGGDVHLVQQQMIPIAMAGTHITKPEADGGINAE